MSLYTIGDLHLHFQTQVPAQNQLRDPVWRNHEEVFRRNCEAVMTDEDTLLLAGDHSWGKNLEECELDMKYIMDLPGRKILLRGNHDMFWDAKKTASLNRRFEGKLFFLQGNYYRYGDYALVGTKGYTFEGPYYLDRFGFISGWDKTEEERARKLVERELGRLRNSFEAARRDGCERFLMFLHYPPTNILEEESGFTKMAEEYGAEQVIYAHCHGESRFDDSLRDELHGIRYTLVSGDCLRWKPWKVAD